MMVHAISSVSWKGDFFMSRLVINKGCGIYTIPFDDILYMEKALRKIRIHTGGADRRHYPYVEFYGKFEDVVGDLDKRFLYCHRSYVINMDKIVLMTRNTIYIEPNKSVYMGRETYAKARKIFRKYLAEKKAEKQVEKQMEKRAEKR